MSNLGSNQSGNFLAAPAPAHKRRIAELLPVVNTASPKPISVSSSDVSDAVQLVQVPMDPNHPLATSVGFTPGQPSNLVGPSASASGGNGTGADAAMPDVEQNNYVYEQHNTYVQQNTQVNDPTLIEQTINAVSQAANANVSMAAQMSQTVSQEADRREQLLRFQLSQYEEEVQRLKRSHEEQLQRGNAAMLKQSNDMQALQAMMAGFMQQQQKQRDTPSPTLQHPVPVSPVHIPDDQVPMASPPGLAPLPQTEEEVNQNVNFQHGIADTQGDGPQATQGFTDQDWASWTFPQEFTCEQPHVPQQQQRSTTTSPNAFCTECGTPLKAIQNFCGNCGARTLETPPP